MNPVGDPAARPGIPAIALPVVHLAHLVHTNSTNANRNEETPMIGQAICALLILAAIFLVEFTLKVTEMGWVSNLNALMIVLGGTLFATLIAYPKEKLVLTARLLKGAFSGRDEERDEAIQTLVNLARIYRNGDIRNLEKQIPRLPQGLLRVGVELIAYRYSRDEIEQMLRRESLAAYNQYATAHKILHNMAHWPLP